MYTYLILLVFLLNGCIAGTKHLGEVPLRDGTFIEGVQIGSSGQDGPKVVAVLEYRYDPKTGTSTKVGEYVASGPSLLVETISGVGPAAFYAGGAVGAAALLRPNKSSYSVSQGGAVSGSTAEGGESESFSEGGESFSEGGKANSYARGGQGGKGGQGGRGGQGGKASASGGRSYSDSSAYQRQSQDQYQQQSQEQNQDQSTMNPMPMMPMMPMPVD